MKASAEAARGCRGLGAHSLRPLDRWAYARFRSACSLPAAAAAAAASWGRVEGGAPACQLGLNCLPNLSTPGHGGGERWGLSGLRGLRTERRVGDHEALYRGGSAGVPGAVGAHMYADRCAGAREGNGLFVCLFAGRLGSYTGEDPKSESGGGGEQHWDSLGFCFSLENVVGPSFLVRLGPLFSGGWAAVAGRPRRRSAAPGAPGPPRLPAGGTGRDAGTGCALPAALGGCQARHLMRSGAFPTRRARSSPSQPRDTPAGVGNAHGLPRLRTRGRARTSLARTRSPAPRDARTVPGAGHTAAGGAGSRPGILPFAPKGHGPGSAREGRPTPSFLSFHNSRWGFCASP